MTPEPAPVALRAAPTRNQKAAHVPGLFPVPDGAHAYVVTADRKTLSSTAADTLSWRLIPASKVTVVGTYPSDVADLRGSLLERGIDSDAGHLADADGLQTANSRATVALRSHGLVGLRGRIEPDGRADVYLKAGHLSDSDLSRLLARLTAARVVYLAGHPTRSVDALQRALRARRVRVEICPWSGS